MRTLFNLGSSQEIQSLKTELQELRDSYHDKRQTYANIVATIDARNEAIQKWFALNEERIAGKYIELVDAFQSGNKKLAVSIIYNLRDIEAAVLSLPVLDNEGRQTTFDEWMDTAFLDEASDGIKSKARAARSGESERIPAFKDVNVQGGPLTPLTYPEVEESFMDKLSGGYKSALQEAIDEMHIRITIVDGKCAEYESESVKTNNEIAGKLDEIGSQMMVASALIRFEQSIKGPLAGTIAGLNAYMPFLVEQYGLDNVLDRLLAQAEPQPLVITLLNKSNYKLNDSRNPFGMIVDFLPDDFARASFLTTLSTMTDKPGQAKALEVEAAKYAGAYIRADKYTLLIPQHAGFAQDKGKHFSFSAWGKTFEVPAAQKNAGSVIEWMATRPEFIKDGKDKIINPDSIYFAAYRETDGQQILSRQYFGTKWDRLPGDEEHGEPFASYAKEFIKTVADRNSRYVAVGDSYVVDKTKINHAWLTQNAQSGTINVKLAMKNGTEAVIENLENLAAARAVIEAIAGNNPDVVNLNMNEIIRFTSIGNIWFSVDAETDQPSLRYVIDGKLYMTEMAKDQAVGVLKTLHNEYGFVNLGTQSRVDLVNPAELAVVFYEDDKKQLKYVFGDGQKEYVTKMDPEQAAAALEKLARAYPLVRHQKMAMVNPDKIARIYYSEDQGELKFVINRTGWYAQVTKKAAASVMREVTRRDNYIKILPHVLLNRESVATLRYNTREGALEYDLNGDTGRYTKMREAEALSIIDTFDSEGKKLAAEVAALKYQGVDLDYDTEEPQEEDLPEQPEAAPEQDNKEPGEETVKKFPKLFSFDPK